jgi:PIN domain-containing protein
LESASKTSAPPPASSWAAPPEFYLDENSVTRRVRRFLADLGYRVHTPGELYGTRDEACGAADTDWLRRVTGTGWVVITRDQKITQRPHELAAYRDTGLHMFLLPGEATAQDLQDILACHLGQICVLAGQRKPAIWKATRSAVRPL